MCFAVFFGDWIPSTFSNLTGMGEVSTTDSSLYSFNTLDSYTSETRKFIPAPLASISLQSSK